MRPRPLGLTGQAVAHRPLDAGIEGLDRVAGLVGQRPGQVGDLGAVAVEPFLHVVEPRQGFLDDAAEAQGLALQAFVDRLLDAAVDRLEGLAGLGVELLGQIGDVGEVVVEPRLQSVEPRHGVLGDAVEPFGLALQRSVHGLPDLLGQGVDRRAGAAFHPLGGMADFREPGGEALLEFLQARQRVFRRLGQGLVLGRQAAGHFGDARASDLVGIGQPGEVVAQHLGVAAVAAAAVLVGDEQPDQGQRQEGPGGEPAELVRLQIDQGAEPDRAGQVGEAAADPEQGQGDSGDAGVGGVARLALQRLFFLVEVGLGIDDGGGGGGGRSRSGTGLSGAGLGGAGLGGTGRLSRTRRGGFGLGGLALLPGRLRRIRPRGHHRTELGRRRRGPGFEFGVGRGGGAGLAQERRDGLGLIGLEVVVVGLGVLDQGHLGLGSEGHLRQRHHPLGAAPGRGRTNRRGRSAVRRAEHRLGPLVADVVQAALAGQLVGPPLELVVDRRVVGHDCALPQVRRRTGLRHPAPRTQVFGVSLTDFD